MAVGAACASSATRRRSTRLSRRASARPLQRSVMGPCSSNGSSRAAATSRSRSSPICTATPSSLFERDCTVQRRHQKIIEESPSPAVDPSLRAAMSAAAVAAARAVGYVGAGTVEFLVDNDGNFFFLEMNTRLQVEHPVTEMITGLDLVELQLAVAGGAPLPEAALHPTITGHAIEVRLCAEDPYNGYLPSSGTFTRVDFPEIEGVRVDTGVASGSVVSPFYDSMFAKVIAHAPHALGSDQQTAACPRAGAPHRPDHQPHAAVGIAPGAGRPLATDRHRLARRPPTN